jgi:hypothetical protein
MPRKNSIIKKSSLYERIKWDQSYEGRIAAVALVKVMRQLMPVYTLEWNTWKTDWLSDVCKKKQLCEPRESRQRYTFFIKKIIKIKIHLTIFLKM